MALGFELAINFGSDEAAAAAARRFVAAHGPLIAGSHLVPLHEPLVISDADEHGQVRIDMCVIPVAVGWGLPADRGLDRVRLTAAELTELGNGLYRLLAGLSGYRAAVVGWDPEGWVDLEELRGWIGGVAAAKAPGLVLAEDVCRDVRGHGFVPFAKGYVWSPYRGELPSGLTADEPA